MVNKTRDSAARGPGRLGSDVPMGTVLAVSGVLLIVIGIVLVTVLGLSQYFATRRPPPQTAGFVIDIMAFICGGNGYPQTTGPAGGTAQRPPPPRLQPRPAVELQSLREQQQAHLDSYGWVDQQAEIVHIPIERAMERLAEQTPSQAQGTSP